jgi:hypothetical protein
LYFVSTAAGAKRWNSINVDQLKNGWRKCGTLDSALQIRKSYHMLQTSYSGKESRPQSQTLPNSTYEISQTLRNRKQSGGCQSGRRGKEKLVARYRIPVFFSFVDLSFTSGY